MEAEYIRQLEEMQIEGTTEYNILHMPTKARNRFIEIISESHPQTTIDFWKQNWKNRDKAVRELTGQNRTDFLDTLCANDVEKQVWSIIWKSIDQSNGL